MKAKIVIENGETEIVLTPENVFDTEFLEKLHSKQQLYNVKTSVEADYTYGSYEKHRLVLNIKKIEA